MKRDLAHMAQQTWDVIVVGGGVTGAGIARDAARRGLRVALLEKADFSSGTSSASSKLAHGGLRYLKTAEFSLVRESLRERRYLSIISPHNVNPLPFLMPIYKDKWIMTAGMLLYDLLSYDKNCVADPTKKMPRFRILSKEDALAIEPGIDPQGLKGGALYYDAQMIYPDRICFEFIRDAVNRGAQVANYAKVTRFIIENGAVTGVSVSDELDSAHSYTVRGALVVNATGPWVDLVFSNTRIELGKGVRRSKGIHLVTRSLTNGHALVLQTKKAGRVFFVLPWRGFSIVGTTDVDYPNQPDQLRVTEKDRDDLIAELNEAYPSAKLSKDEVLYSYIGIRPLIEELGKSSTEVSRKHELYDHEERDHIKNLITVLGGKWTTTRELAEEVVNGIFKKLGKPPVSCTTREPLDVAQYGLYSTYLATELKRWKGRHSPTLIKTLLETYGSRYQDILALSVASPADSELIKAGNDEFLMGQVTDAVQNEMACHLDDVLRRRTGIGTLGHAASKDHIDRLSRRMAKLLHWDDARRQDEINRYYQSFAILPV